MQPKLKLRVEFADPCVTGILIFVAIPIKQMFSPCQIYSVNTIFAGEDQPDRGEPVVTNPVPPSGEVNESPVHQPVENHQPTDQHQLSSLELENKLLKNEVASLNQEMASALNRAKKAQTGEYKLKNLKGGTASLFYRCIHVVLWNGDDGHFDNHVGMVSYCGTIIIVLL